MVNLFTDKYNPTNLKDLDYNFELNRELLNVAKVKNLPHLMFCGIPGSGKKTRAMLFLKERFGELVTRVKKKEVIFKYPNKTIEFQFLYSSYHYQVDPSLHGVYDRSIIQDMIRKIMQLQLGTTDLSIGSHKVIVIENADKLTHEAQQSLRRTMELYVKSCRFIFLVNNEGNMIDPLQSRCLKLRVAAPSDEDLQAILENIIEKEQLNVSENSLKNLIKYSDKNLNTLINQLQILAMKSSDQLADSKGIAVQAISDIHAHIKLLVDTIFIGTNLGCLSTIRGYLYNLLVNCVTPTDVIKLIFDETLSRIPDTGFKYKYEIIKTAKKYDHTVRLGSKPIYHLEALVIQLFNIIKLIQLKITNRATNTCSTNDEPSITAGTTAITVSTSSPTTASATIASASDATVATATTAATAATATTAATAATSNNAMISESIPSGKGKIKLKVQKKIVL